MHISDDTILKQVQRTNAAMRKNRGNPKAGFVCLIRESVAKKGDHPSNHLWINPLMIVSIHRTSTYTIVDTIMDSFEVDDKPEDILKMIEAA